MAADRRTAELLTAMADDRLIYWGIDCLECGSSNPLDDSCDTDSTHTKLAPMFILLPTKEISEKYTRGLVPPDSEDAF